MPDATTPSDMSYWTPRSSPSPTHASPRDSADGGARMLPNYNIYRYDETSDFVMQSLISPLPRSVTPPQHLVLPEQLFNAIKIYFSGSLDNRAWISNEHDRLVSTRTSPTGEAQALLDTVSQFSHLCNSSRHLLRAKDFYRSRSTIVKGVWAYQRHPHRRTTVNIRQYMFLPFPIPRRRV
jgi:hypothetical protein